MERDLEEVKERLFRARERYSAWCKRERPDLWTKEERETRYRKAVEEFKPYLQLVIKSGR